MAYKTRTKTVVKLESPTIRMELEAPAGVTLSNLIKHLIHLTVEYSELDEIVEAVNERRERMK